jgi:Helix-turn-helix domain
MDRKQIPDPGKMIVQLTVGELDEIVTAAMATALGKQPPAKLAFTLEEAAQMLNMKAYLLAQRCREKAVPFHRNGHRYYFTQADIDEILQSGAVTKKGGE